MKAGITAGTLRLARRKSLGLVALLAPSAIAFAQAVVVTGTAIAPRADSTKRSNMVIVRKMPSPRIDSLVRALNELQLGSPEYARTQDSLFAALRENAPVSNAQGGAVAGTFSVRINGMPTPAALATPMDDIMPRGWLGFRADGVNIPWVDPSGSYVQYLEYPTVVFVEPNSPASRAGVRFGDMVLAFDGLDLRRNSINLTRLFVPGHDLSVKVRRDGDMRDLSISVGKAPASIESERRVQAIAGSLMPTRTPLDSNERKAVEIARVGSVVAARAGNVAAGAFAPSPPVRRSPSPMASTIPAGILGAAMTNVDPDMAESIVGMKGRTGVFVTGVPVGSPAERAGIKPFDVILKIDGTDAYSLGYLRSRLIQAEMTRVEKVKLTILRAGKIQDLQLETSR